MLWLYDPFTLLALILAYAIGFVALMSIAGYIAPRVAWRFAGRFTIRASMLIVGLLIVVSGLAGLILIIYSLASVAGFDVVLTSGFIVSLALFLLIANLISYLLSPFLINLMYGAKPDEHLQEIVNEVSARLGLSKPPKAVIVNSPPNAFAYGSIISGRYVAVSRELAEMLSRDELEAVIGHELGHHLHRDNAIMLFMGLLPSLIYFMGVFLIRAGLISSTARLSSRRREGASGGLLLLLVGVAAVVLSFVIQVLVLAFSRLREYYADTSGASASSPRSMQRALAKLHVYYEGFAYAREVISTSKIKALFIYALTEAVANPLYHYGMPSRRVDWSHIDIDEVIEELKKKEVSSIQEYLSTHPPTPKRLRFLDKLRLGEW